MGLGRPEVVGGQTGRGGAEKPGGRVPGPTKTGCGPFPERRRGTGRAFAAGLNRLRRTEVLRSVTETAIAALPELLGRADSPASLMAADAAAPAEPAEVIAASCAALVAELLEALDESVPGH